MRTLSLLIFIFQSIHGENVPELKNDVSVQIPKTLIPVDVSDNSTRKQSDLDWGPPLSEIEKTTRSRSISSENQTMSDMMKDGLQREKRLDGRSIQRGLKYRWPNSIIPYLIESTFTEEHRVIIASGIENVESNTCIRFVPKQDSDIDWLEIYSTGASGCFANSRYLGPGHGKHDIGLEIGSPQTGTCVDKGVVVHELLHILGVAHEQQRPDRDSYVTMNWPNIQVANAHNMYRDSWETEDLSTATICNNEGVSQASADFSSCVSGDTVTDFGVGYDFKSVMHYSLGSFAVDRNQPVMIPKDSSIQDADVGGNELSAKDILKLQRAYFCDGTIKATCGGAFFSSTGGSISGDAITGTNECEFILSTDPGKKITLTLTAQFAGTCLTDYLEVRIGREKNGLLIGKYCQGTPIPATLEFKTNEVWIRWVKTDSTFSGTWSVSDLTCSCNKIIIEKSDLKILNGAYTKIEAVRGGKPIYQKEQFYLVWSDTRHEWYISPDYTTDSYYAINKVAFGCPEDLKSEWEYYNSDLDATVPDTDASARCSDCSLYPEYEECQTCSCQVLKLDFNSNLDGLLNKVDLTIGDRPVYQHPDSGIYLFFHPGISQWLFGPDITTTNYYFRNERTDRCPSALDSGWINFELGTVSCNDATTTAASTTSAAPTTAAPTAEPPTTEPPTTEPPTNEPPTTEPPTTEPPTTEPPTTEPPTTEPPTTEPPTTEPPTTEPPTTEPPTTEPPTTEPPTTEPPTTEPPTTAVPTTEPPTTEPPTTAPPTTEPPTTEPPTTEPPTTEPPTTAVPTTAVPTTEPPTTEPPTTAPPTTEPPTTEPPTTEPPTTEPPTTEPPTIEPPTTEPPTTEPPTTEPPTTAPPTTEHPTTEPPTTEPPTNERPTTEPPTTVPPTTEPPTTEPPTTEPPTTEPTTTEPPTTAVPTTEPPTTEPPTTEPPTTDTLSPCFPCKNVLNGPLQGLYTLQDGRDPRCSDGCAYKDVNEDIFCFLPGKYYIQPTCN